MAAMEFLEALKPRREVDLTVKRSGKWTTRPVWFAVEGSAIYLLPMYGLDTKWYKYAIANPEIELSVSGKTTRAHAGPVLDAEKLADVIELFRSKYAELGRYYRKLEAAVAVTI